MVYNISLLLAYLSLPLLGLLLASLWAQTVEARALAPVRSETKTTKR